MNTTTIPSRPGQICKLVSAVPDMEAEEVYIIAEDPAEIDCDGNVLIVNLKELQRNIRNPDAAARETARKDELVVISDDLESYISGWNER